MEVLEYEELSDFFENNFDFEDYSYFYHMTGEKNGDLILENGLLMAENNIYKTAIKINKNDINNIDQFLESGSGKTDFRDEMVLICIEKEEEKFLINSNNSYDDNWVLEDKPSYIIYPENIIGYINLSDKTLKVNDRCDYINHDIRGI